MSTTTEITHGSIEAVPFLLARDDVPVTDPTGVTCTLVPGGANWETGSFAPAVLIAGDLCHQLDGSEPVGPYDLYVRVVANPESLIVPPRGLRVNIV